MTGTTPSWTISVTGALRAHFRQPDGPSKPGADWSVALTKYAQTHSVFVRVYAEDVTGYTQEEEAQAVARYVGSLLQSGWTPLAYRDMPGELTFPKPPLEAPVHARGAEKPWWKFW